MPSQFLPSDPVGARLCQFFNHPWGFIQKFRCGNGWTNWTTETKYPIEPRNLWGMYQNPNVLVGVRFGQTTSYALLDVDTGSPYHPDEDENKFRQLLAHYGDIGLVRSLTLQSSFSGGLHTYFPLPYPVRTYKLASVLKLLPTRYDYKVKDGWLETFPNTKRWDAKRVTNYKAHRLPLQSGSYLLDDDLMPYSTDIERFIDDAAWCAKGQDMELLLKIIILVDRAKENKNYFGKKSDKVIAWEEHLLIRINEGWTDFGQTNFMLLDIGTYGRVFQGLSSIELAGYIEETAKNAKGYKLYCRHQHNITQRSRDWAKCIEKFYWSLGSIPVRESDYKQMTEKGSKENVVNSQRSIEARQRIITAVEHLQKIDNLPLTVNKRLEAILEISQKIFNTKPSRRTLKSKEYLPLWHPNYISTNGNNTNSQFSD